MKKQHSHTEREKAGKNGVAKKQERREREEMNREYKNLLLMIQLGVGVCANVCDEFGSNDVDDMIKCPWRLFTQGKMFVQLSVRLQHTSTSGNRCATLDIITKCPSIFGEDIEGVTLWQ